MRAGGRSSLTPHFRQVARVQKEPVIMIRFVQWRTAGIAVAGLLTLAPIVTAQDSPVDIRGRVLTAEGQVPLPAVTVTLEERRLTAFTDEQGEFVFPAQAPGTVHVRTSVTGFAPVRKEVVVAAGMPSVDVLVKDDLHYAEVVSVSPHPRDPFESYQPTSVLSGQELAIKLEGSLGALLKTEPGVAERSLGSGPSRPVIRGQDGDRVLILQDSQRTADLSSQSADHGVAINPAAASQVEVVRGPATLLYGANAIGGLVNVVSNQIPTRPATSTTGALQIDVASNAGDAGASGDLTVGNGRWAFNAGGSGRRAGDFSTPLGEVPNSQTRGAFGSVGLARTSQNGYLGASVTVDDTRYGVPVVEDGTTELNPRRRVLNSRGEIRNLTGLFSSVRGSLAYHHYRHEELQDQAPQTFFRNDLLDVDLRAAHRAVGRITGTVGVGGYARSFSVDGNEVLSPPVDQDTFSAFSYQEVAWSHATLQFGGRYDHAAYTPGGGLRPRSFNNLSFSSGVLVRPTDASVLAVSIARAARNPALEELYFFGDHPGNFTFEIGNQDLDSEVAYGLDVSYRVRRSRVSAEVSYFNNTINNYIFRSPLDLQTFATRPGLSGGSDLVVSLPIIEYVGRDARLQGAEAHADIDVASGWHVEVGFDTVRGSLRGSSDPLPRMPPTRLTTGLRYHRDALQLGAQVVAAATQDRVYQTETPTDGYGLLKLFGAYSFETRGAVNTMTVRLDNATDRLYRNHLSYIKDVVPEMGRSVRVVYGVRF